MRTIVYLHDVDWFQRLLDGKLALAPPIQVPAESPSYLLNPSALDELRKHLDSVLSASGVQERARALRQLGEFEIR